MATTVTCEFLTVPQSAKGWVENLPVPGFPTLSFDLTTNGATNVVSSDVAPSEGVWQITPVGGDVRVTAGSAPTVTTAASAKVLDGRPRQFVAKQGDKIAVKDA